MSCNWCNESGVVFAAKKNGMVSPYGFRCGCPRGDVVWQRGLPKWEKSLEVTFIPEYIDAPLLNTWIIEQFENGKTKDEEFQRRLKIWGRERFEKIWEKYKEEKKDG